MPVEPQTPPSTPEKHGVKPIPVDIPPDGVLADGVRLDKIDKLTALGVGDYVALPQLVVVGDQSSGKSSVLEGLTELPFPRDTTLCTRFATRIVFRRAPDESKIISIIPASSSNKERIKKLKKFQMTGGANLTADSFKDILAKASQVMGLPGPGEEPSKGQRAFSEDILSIELSGPKLSHLSVIDVPGIFRLPDPPLTEEEDTELVYSMVKRFIEDSRTIMIAVLPANVDFATQEILRLAEEADPSGDRTLGVFTKPDLVEPGAEKDIINIVDGKRKPLKLGYCVVRNRKISEKDSTADERHKNEEAFFRDGPFSQLRKDRVGIRALRSRLQTLLRDATRREFPKVRKEIDKKLQDCANELNSMGPSRQSEEQQRKFLMNIANKYQDAAGCAIEAQYGRNEYLQSYGSIRIATEIVKLNDSFATKVSRKGHSVAFEGNDAEDESKDGADGIDANESEADEVDPEESEVSEIGSGGIGTDNVDPELFGLFDHHNDRLPGDYGDYGDILGWLQREFEDSRGFELGTFNPSILPMVFREFTCNWELLTMIYLESALTLVHRFSREVLSFYVQDERVRTALWDVLQDDFRAQYIKTKEQLKFLLATERSGTLMTTNHYFTQNLNNMKKQQVREQLAKHNQNAPFQNGKLVSVNVDRFADDSRMSNDEHTVRAIHDVLRAYYKVARKRFVDNVCMQGTDYHLISGPGAVLHRFCPEYVLDMSAARLETVAGEDLATVERRAALAKEIESLQAGKAILIG